jgi:hypothetical protein
MKNLQKIECAREPAVQLKDGAMVRFLRIAGELISSQRHACAHHEPPREYPFRNTTVTH